MKTGRIVREGVPTDILDNPAATYTRELMAAIPTLESPLERARRNRQPVAAMPTPGTRVRQRTRRHRGMLNAKEETVTTTNSPRAGRGADWPSPWQWPWAALLSGGASPPGPRRRPMSARRAGRDPHGRHAQCPRRQPDQYEHVPAGQDHRSGLPPARRQRCSRTSTPQGHADPRSGGATMPEALDGDFTKWRFKVALRKGLAWSTASRSARRRGVHREMLRDTPKLAYRPLHRRQIKDIGDQGGRQYRRDRYHQAALP